MILQSLNDCDKTPIHSPKALLPFGFLVVLSPQNRELLRVGEPPSSLARLYEDIVRSLQKKAGESEYREFFDDGALYEISSHFNGEYILIEGMRTTHSRAAQNLKLPTELLRIFDKNDSWEGLFFGVCEFVAELSGFSRVMVYRFDEFYNGEVIAEHKREGIASFLHHHFPAGDIPKPARDMYLKNPVRIIPSSKAAPQEFEFDGELDMSFCALRAVAPLHLEYLANMGVDASMSISLIVGGRLWGLVACHDEERREILLSSVLLFTVISKMLSHEIGVREQKEYFERLSRKESSLDLACETLRHHLATGNRRVGFEGFCGSLAEIFDANGVLIFEGAPSIDATVYRNGVLPNELFECEIRGFLEGKEHFFVSEQMSEVECRGEYAGIVSALIPSSPTVRIVLLFKESIHTIVWAGRPAKDDTSGTLSPRSSFDAWKEVVKERSLPITKIQRELASKLPQKLEELITTAVLAAEANRLVFDARAGAMEEMIGLIAHHWRQPITAIGMAANNIMLDIALGQSDCKTTVGTLEKIESQVQYLSKTIDNFRNFFDSKATPKKIAVGTLVERAYETASETLKEEGISLSLKLSGDDAALSSVIVYESEILQLLLIFCANAEEVLLDNGVKEPKIELSYGIVPNKKECFIAVSDNGGGVPDEIGARIFEPYFTTKKEKNGTGLGLYLAKTVIDKHDGASIGVQNRDGGASFWIRLPICEDES